MWKKSITLFIPTTLWKKYVGFEDYYVRAVYAAAGETVPDRQEQSEKLTGAYASKLLISRNQWNNNVNRSDKNTITYSDVVDKDGNTVQGFTINDSNDSNSAYDKANTAYDRLYIDYVAAFDVKGLTGPSIMTTYHPMIKVEKLVDGVVKSTTYQAIAELDNKGRIEMCTGINGLTKLNVTKGTTFRFTPVLTDGKASNPTETTNITVDGQSKAFTTQSFTVDLYFALKNNTVVEQIDFTYAVNLQRIGLYAFSGCENLAFVDVPASVSSVGFSAFRDCTSLYRASFLGNGTKVPDETFLNCSSLEIVELSPDLTEIGDFAFANCTALEYLELPASVTAIGNNAFLNDENLTLGVYYGSFAQTYAEENGIPYVIIGGVKLGDVNGDKVVNINDVTAIQSHLAEMNKLEGIFLKAADVNQNGDVKIDDATALQMYLAEYEVQYPVDEEMPKS